MTDQHKQDVQDRKFRWRMIIAPGAVDCLHKVGNIIRLELMITKLLNLSFESS